MGETANDITNADAERDRRKRMRSIAIALALGGMVLMFYVATIVRMGGNVMNRPLAIFAGSMMR